MQGGQASSDSLGDSNAEAQARTQLLPIFIQTLAAVPGNADAEGFLPFWKVVLDRKSFGKTQENLAAFNHGLSNCTLELSVDDDDEVRLRVCAVCADTCV